MAKYKKKKTSDASQSTTQTPPATSISLPQMKAPPGGASSKEESKRAKKMAAGSIKLQFAGDLVLVKNTQNPLTGLFKRYTDLFEALANMDKDHRNLIYRFMTGLMITSHAKKSQNTEAKRKLFEQKNELFVAMANERSLRRIFEFKYLVSKNFRVLSYCTDCTKRNTEESVDRHKWKYCKSCDVDHNFYNLLCMEVKFPQGWARLFLSNDQIPRLKGFKLPRKVKAGDLAEEAMFDRYHYNSRNLDAIELESVLSLYNKLQTQPLAIGVPEPRANLADKPRARVVLQK